MRLVCRVFDVLGRLLSTLFFFLSTRQARVTLCYPLDLRSNQSSAMLAVYHVRVFLCSNMLISDVFTEALIF